jgi:hypothetical protein
VTGFNKRFFWGCIILGGLSPYFSGCSPAKEPPETFAVDPEFSEMQAAAIRDARDAWCQAVDFCPVEVEFGSQDRGNILVDAGYWRFGENNNLLGWNDTNNVRVNPNNAWINDPIVFWFGVAHELGHFGIQEHTDRGVMSDTCTDHADDQPALDVYATMAWEAGN